MKRISVFVMLLLVLGLLMGCSGVSIEEMYCLPEATEDYYDLQTALSEVLSSGMSYLAPTSGRRQETVQLVDLDLDGTDEAVAFFKDASDGTIKTYVFTKIDDAYEAAVINCAGSALSSMDYGDVNGNGSLELLLRCQVSESVTQALQVCGYEDGRITELLNVPCGRYELVDLDGSGGSELLCLSDGGVQLYRHTDGGFTQTELSLSGDLERLQSIQEGSLSNGKTAVFLSSVSADDRLMTDIFTLDNGCVKAVAPGNAVLQSNAVHGCLVMPCDIDEDGSLEVASAKKLPSYGEGLASQYVMGWYDVDSTGRITKKCETYHDFGDGWYFVLPEMWQDRILVRESDTATAELTVSTTSFYRLNDQGKAGEEQLTLYVLRGDEKQRYAEEENLNILSSDNDLILAVKLNEKAEVWEGTTTVAQVSDRFHVTSEDLTIYDLQKIDE